MSNRHNAILILCYPLSNLGLGDDSLASHINCNAAHLHIFIIFEIQIDILISFWLTLSNPFSNSLSPSPK